MLTLLKFLFYLYCMAAVLAFTFIAIPLLVA